MTKIKKKEYHLRISGEIREDLYELASRFGTITLKKTICELIQRYHELEILFDQEIAKRGQ